MFSIVLFYLGTVESFLFMLWRWHNKLNEPLSSCLLPHRRCGLGAGFIPLRAIVNKKTVLDEWVTYVAGHPLLNRRCTGLPVCSRLRNDLYCVGWGIVKLHSLTHSLPVPHCSYDRACSFYSVLSYCLAAMNGTISDVFVLLQSSKYVQSFFALSSQCSLLSLSICTRVEMSYLLVMDSIAFLLVLVHLFVQ